MNEMQMPHGTWHRHRGVSSTFLIFSKSFYSSLLALFANIHLGWQNKELFKKKSNFYE